MFRILIAEDDPSTARLLSAILKRDGYEPLIAADGVEALEMLDHNHIDYHEGIYVGYRYYETRSAVDSSFDYTEQVVWPFGYGLSYTMFQQKILSLTEDKAALYLTVQVRNEGKKAGKALVQVYLTAPYHGTIEKSSVVLLAFEKTKLLSDGETDAIVLTIPKKDLSSFDKQSGKWVLESGSYQLTLRADAHTVLDAAAWLVEAPIYFEGTSRLYRPFFAGANGKRPCASCAGLFCAYGC